MKRFLAVIAAVGLAACGGSGGSSSTDEGTGTLTMGIMAGDSGGGGTAVANRAALASTALSGTSATLTINGPWSFHRQYTSGVLPWNFSDNPLRVGHYTYEATANVGAATFKATGDFDIAKGKMTNISVVMQQTNATPLIVKAPYIKQITVLGLNENMSGGWGEPIQLTAKVDWPDNDYPDMDTFLAVWSSECVGTETGNSHFVLPLDIKWFMDLGPGGFVLPWANVGTFFTSYCQGVEKITLSVTNFENPSCSGPGCEIVSSVTFSIPYDPQGVAGAIDFNYAPRVTCDRIQNAEPLPGGAVLLNAVASDPDDGLLTFQWADNGCGGAFADPAALDTSWTAPNEFGKECTLKLTVTDDRGGKNYGTIKVKTAPEVLVH